MTKRNVGLIVLVVGITLVLAAVTADLIGLGAQPGFGWKQIAGAGLGVVVAIVGGILTYRK